MGKRNIKKYRRVLISLLAAWTIGLVVWYVHLKNFAVLNPKGIVALRQQHLMIVTLLLSLIVVIPVYVMLFSFAWRYREGNKHAKYSPNLDGNRLAEGLWWGIPTALIVVLSVITWNTSHSLDPHRSIDAAQPLTIQVVALQWNWLFIYPEQKIASLNHVELPVGQPVKFNITADAPMNSFWIPQLGSQIYAMPGMSTTLNLRADQVGNYDGSSANISGRGFADMRFTARADKTSDFEAWLQSTQQTGSLLDLAGYDRLAKPTDHQQPQFFSSVPDGLYNHVLSKYIGPGRS